MTRVDFYVLQDAAARNRDVLACRLAEKAWLDGLQVYIQTDSPEHARMLDDLLWTFHDRSFVPHATESNAAPVCIGCDGSETTAHEVLINLGAAVPNCFSRFDRVLEIVNGDTTVREDGRVRFKFYRDRGYSLETHNL